MREQNAGKGAKFDGKVAVAYRIQRVLGGRFKAEQLRRVGAVNRVGSTGQCSGAEWQIIHALAAIQQAAIVALQHFKPGENVMTKGHRLRGLQMGKTGHDGIGIGFRQLQHALLQAGELFGDSVDFVAHIQAYVGGDLIVARATGMKLFTGDANALGEQRFDVHVHIFKAD